jgi:hypothetical protein
MATPNRHKQLVEAALVVHKATGLVVVTQTEAGDIGAQEGAVAAAMATGDDVVCVLRPGLPESQARAVIYYQLLERERMMNQIS